MTREMKYTRNTEHESTKAALGVAKSSFLV